MKEIMHEKVKENMHENMQVKDNMHGIARNVRFAWTTVAYMEVSQSVLIAF